ncbi:hypothetical protein AB6A40_002043 [Gnathostoma spinigerum]|uniref:Tonsoku-like protein n=1 Tax=Gnathostoma spinigerum TaxID=75299 RepID=A0ABD6EDC3_9BILA
MGRMRKTHENEIIRDLKRRLSYAETENNAQKISEFCCDLGHEYKRLGDSGIAESYFEKAALVAEKAGEYESAAFANRALSELFVDPESGVRDDAKALDCGRKYLDAAVKSHRIHLIQLAYHVLGWLYFQIWCNSAVKDLQHLSEAKVYCEKSLKYVVTHAHEIDSDKDAIQIGKDSRTRKARLQQLLSEICDKLGLSADAVRHLNSAIAYAVRSSDFDLHYRCLLSKLDFLGDNRLKTANELVHLAKKISPKEAVGAKYILAQEKLRANDFEGAKWDLISIVTTCQINNLDPDETKYANCLLTIVYRTVSRLEVSEGAANEIRLKIYEKIADDFIEVHMGETYTDLMLQVALHFYEQMLSCAQKDSDRVRALVSIAATAKDLGYFERAYQTFLEVERIERNIHLNQEKRAVTAICIADAAANAHVLPTEEILKLFERAEDVVVTNQQKRDLLESYVEFLKPLSGYEKQLNESLTKLESVISSGVSEGNEESDSETDSSPWMDQFDKMDDLDILMLCREEGSRRSAVERIRAEKDKKINSHGETRLHEAARGVDTNYLKLLVREGYNVNARDEGGWTPLHEAVGSLKLENAKVLLQSGARVDLRSTAGTLSSEGEATDTGGLTPLMEACDRGSVVLVDLLLRFGASATIENSDGWTAVDFFRNAMQNGVVDEDDRAEAERLLEIMENKQKQANFPVRRVPPPKNVGKPITNKQTVCVRSEEISLDKKNLKEYQRTIQSLGRRTIHATNIDHEVKPTETGDEVELSDEFDDLLYGDESPKKASTNPFSPTTSHSFSCSPTLPFNQTSSTVPQNVRTSQASCSYALSAQHSSSTRKRQQSGRKQDRSHIIDDWLLETPYASDVIDDHVDDGVIVCGQRLPTTVVVSPSSSDPLRSCSKRRKFQESESSVLVPSVTKVEVQSAQSSLPRLLVKIEFRTNDGQKLKTKGMPFLCSATIGDVKLRCESELRNDGVYESLIIAKDGCELSNDTAIDMILNKDDNVLDCIVQKWAQPSLFQIYSTKAKRVFAFMADIANELKNTEDGFLDFSKANVSNDIVLFEVLSSSLPTDCLSSLNLSGSCLPKPALNVIRGLMKHLTKLHLACCGLDIDFICNLSKSSETYSKMRELDLSFNSLCSSSINETQTPVASLLRRTPNLKSLHLASCCISGLAVDSVIGAIAELTALEFLDLSFNSLSSTHIVTILESCTDLVTLNLVSIGVITLHYFVSSAPKLSRLRLSICNLEDSVPDFPRFMQLFPNLTFADLSSTDISEDAVEKFIRQKNSTPPLLVLRLLNCFELEADQQIARFIQSDVSTNFMIRLEFSRQMRSRILGLIPDSFSFFIL